MMSDLKLRIKAGTSKNRYNRISERNLEYFKKVDLKKKYGKSAEYFIWVHYSFIIIYTTIECPDQTAHAHKKIYFSHIFTMLYGQVERKHYIVLPVCASYLESLIRVKLKQVYSCS